MVKFWRTRRRKPLPPPRNEKFQSFFALTPLSTPIRVQDIHWSMGDWLFPYPYAWQPHAQFSGELQRTTPLASR